ncbi:hypothetical protein F3Y22_tig00015095pilonHSYRG00007 [Hibiscus syriacus]|uniref:Uncharacterized protein n=1 Tax=Hibiscus syriacus TaxID=106335 RepID=A0A6A3BYQ8_HIBSY|nr:uncharacterized protein LOC120207607 [Hibiscus syriacus]XP_039062972.1 uncharacterized protein LOC120207607 [Hibiscus syriacus]KAE8721833.1 hypothetical protein F3Y22_tig00015095pilonHSYRG00007 [Hibiscus syriacus]
MDPCPFVRILVGNFALKFPPSTNTSLSRIHPSTSPYFFSIKLSNFPHQVATIPFIVSQQDGNNCSSSLQKSVAACFSLGKSEIDRIIKGSSSCNVSIMIYACPNGSTCGLPYKKLLGKVSVPLDLRGAESRPCVVHNGWITIGRNKSNKDGSSPKLSLTVRTEPDPRFVFKFGGEPECSPQVFQVQGSLKQAVFTCKFGFKNSGDRNLGSRSSLFESKTSRNWLPSLKSDKDQFFKERKGWSITIHNLSGSPVAMASMVTPFVPSPGSDRVTRSNPGAWLILRPGCGTWKPWGRLEAWSEPGFTDALGYRFDIFHDDIATTNATTTIATSTISTKHGGKFTIDTTTTYVATTPSITPQSSGDFGSSTSGSRPGSGSGSDFGFWTSLSPQKSFRSGGFVMSSMVEGVGKCSEPEVEVGVNHVTCTEDAAAFVALAAAMDLSMDACLSFSTKLRKELRQQTQNFVV